MISKRKISILIILVLLIAAFQTLALTSYARHALALITAGGAVGYFVLFRYFSSFPKPIRFWGVIMLFLFGFSILTAFMIKDQPIRQGVVANIQFIVAGVAFLIYYWSYKYKIDFDETSMWIIRISWGLFILYLFLFWSGTTFQSADAEKAFGLQHLRKGFINLGVMIYVSWFFRHGNIKYLLLGVLLFSVNHWDDFQRFLFFSFSFCLGIAIFFNKKQISGLKMTIILLILFPTALFVLPNTKIGKTMAQKFDYVYELFDPSGSSYSESSVSARVEETAIAMKSIEKYPYTGIGRIASSYKKKLMGDTHFFVTDIGFVGILYTFGIPGILAIIYQLALVFRKTISRNLFKNEVTTSLKLFLLYIFLNSIMTGSTLFQPAEFMIVLSLIFLGDQFYLESKDA